MINKQIKIKKQVVNQIRLTTCFFVEFVIYLDSKKVIVENDRLDVEDKHANVTNSKSYAL